MRIFCDDDFLLFNDTAKKLYHECAENLPIIDYHCHLSPKDIAEDRKYTNIAQLWLQEDHYKWRAMRCCGVDERYITGESSDYDKFREYCRIMPDLIGNPLYHWSHMELRRYFGIELLINEKNCDEIWKRTSEILLERGWGAKDFIYNSKVKILCTTDDPADALDYHRKIQADGFSVKVYPTFRPDKGMNIKCKGIRAYLSSLGEKYGVEIKDYDSLCSAYSASLDEFESLGCRIADHGFDNCVRFIKPDKYHADLIINKAIENDGAYISDEELALWQCQMMRFFGREYVKRNWAMQIHYGALRNASNVMYEKLGSDAGFDTIYGKSCICDIAKYLDYLMCENALPKTIIYPLNPSDNMAIAALCGSFCSGSGANMPNVVQGSAWWFNDNCDGIASQLTTFANVASLGKFVGMVTDSRSIISYPRHEYFRRIVCNLIGRWAEEGRYPCDIETLFGIVRNISFYNAVKFFDF